MITSETVAKLFAAIVAAQADMTNAPKETKGQVGNQVRYYTDLPTLTDLVRPILAKHGLAYIQLPAGGGDGHVTLSTRIVHESGEWVESEFAMPTGGNGAQGVGSALSYARRYSLMAALGVAADDDDGAAASKQQATRTPKETKPGKPSEAITKRSMAMFAEAGVTDRGVRLELTSAAIKRPVSSWSDVTAKEADTVMDVLDKLIKGTVSFGYEDDGSLSFKAVA